MVSTEATQTVDTWRLRADLEFVWMPASSACAGYWIVKDPVSAEPLWLNDRDKQILCRADGTVEINVLAEQLSSQDGFRFVTQNHLLSFFLQAKRKGLLVDQGAGDPLGRVSTQFTETHRSNERSLERSIRWLSKALFLRLGGWNPSRFLDLVQQWAPSLSRNGRWVVFWITLVIAACIVIGRFDTLAMELSTTVSRTDLGWIGLVVAAIAMAKSIHELAHAVACRSAGIDCREIGISFLVGIPCLYCDVTDLWTVPDRRKRLLVASAGMMAELYIAALATMLWATTHASLLHELSLMLMVVCSISTIAINANPLLRYDGYYILSDLIEVPNLATRSRSVLSQSLRRVIWGASSGGESLPVVGRDIGDAWLVAYAVASGCYRLILLSIIMTATYAFLATWGLGWIAALLALAMLLGFLARPIRRLVEPPEVAPNNAPVDATICNDAKHATKLPTWLRYRRSRSVLMAATLSLFATLFFPLPRSENVPVVIVASQTSDIHAPRGGLLSDWNPVTRDVASGDRLMRLFDAEMECRIAALEADLEVSRVALKSLRRLRGDDTTTSSRIAVAEQRYLRAQESLQQLCQLHSQLEIVAPKSGQFVPRPVDEAFEVGQFIEPGTLLGWVGDATSRSGFGICSQLQVGEIRPGQTVRLIHPSVPSGHLIGRVENVAEAPLMRLPDEVIGTMTPRRLGAPFYAVEIRWQDTEVFPLPLRVVSTAQISVDRASVVEQIRRRIFSLVRGI